MSQWREGIWKPVWNLQDAEDFMADSCGPMGELWVMVTNQELRDDPAVETPKLPSVELQDHTSASRFSYPYPGR
jgi:hypothetical protein